MKDVIDSEQMKTQRPTFTQEYDPLNNEFIFVAIIDREMLTSQYINCRIYWLMEQQNHLNFRSIYIQNANKNEFKTKRII